MKSKEETLSEPDPDLYPYHKDYFYMEVPLAIHGPLMKPCTDITPKPLTQEQKHSKLH